jgi:DnaK suppressor protein
MKLSESVKETKQRLMRRRDALRRALAGDMSMLRSLHEGSVGDEVDAAIATEQSEVRSQMASFESRELAQIETALDRIKQGRYGRCDSCDKAIGAVRLRALPYATSCIQCARTGERHMSGDRNSPLNRLAAYRGEDESADEAYEEIR